MSRSEKLTKDLIGQRFGLLVVTAREGSSVRRQAMWRCTCDCGSSAVVAGFDLRSGHSGSCGCQRGANKVVHGLARTFEHRCWRCMIARCTRPSYKHYSYYGGRGITIAPEWLGADGFVRFLAHIGPAPSDKHTIDRIETDGHYEPGNVRWATRREQVMNTRRMIAYQAARGAAFPMPKE